MPPLGEHWEISPEEAKKLSAAQRKAFRHIAPSVSETFADWFAFAQVSAGIIGPRALQTSLQRREARATRPPAAATTAPIAATSSPSSAPQVVPPQPTATMPKGPRTPAELDPIASLNAQVTAGTA